MQEERTSRTGALVRPRLHFRLPRLRSCIKMHLRDACGRSIMPTTIQTSVTVITGDTPTKERATLLHVSLSLICCVRLSPLNDGAHFYTGNGQFRGCCSGRKNVGSRLSLAETLPRGNMAAVRSSLQWYSLCNGYIYITVDECIHGISEQEICGIDE